MTMRPKGNDRFRSGFDGGLLQPLSGNSNNYGYGNSVRAVARCGRSGFIFCASNCLYLNGSGTHGALILSPDVAVYPE